MIVGIKDGDPVRLLDHLHADVDKDVRQPSGPALVARDRSGDAAQLDFAVSLYGLRRFGLQDRIAVVADKLEEAARERTGPRRQRPTVVTEKLPHARLVKNGARTR
jgi:hypothetical protein